MPSPPRRSSPLLVRLSLEERERIRSAAEAAGLGSSPWVRSIALAAAPAAPLEAPDPALREGEVVTPQAPQGEPITYRAIEARELVPSHDPWSFGPSPAYPAGLNEREYHRQAEEQLKVTQGAQRLDPRLLLTDTPSAVDGPPIVTGSWTHDGPPFVVDGRAHLVLGGNGRSMMLLRAFKSNPAARDAYRAALLRKAPAFGLSRAEIKRMDSPVLVRVAHGLTSSSPRRELISAIRRFNEGLTQALSTRARAVAEAGVMSPAALAAVAALLEASPDATLREVMGSRGRELADVLRQDGIITSRNSSELLAADGTLTNSAKDRIEAMFLGRILGTGDRFAQTPAAMLAKLERIVPSLVKVAAVNPSADAIPSVQGAVDLINDAGRRRLTLEQMARQVDLLGEGPPPAARVALARILSSEGPLKLAARFRRWASEAAVDPRQGGLFGGAPSAGDLEAIMLR